MADDPDPPGSEPSQADNPIAQILTFDLLAGLVERSKADPGAPYLVLPQIAKLWREDLPAYEAMILRLKKETKCRVGPLEGAVAALAKRTADAAEPSGRGKESNGKAKHGGQAQEDKALGAAITFAVLEPWPEPVDGAALLDELVNALRAYVVLTAVQANATALWIVFTHAHDAFDTSPRLVAKSPQKRSGKTTLFRVLSRLVAKPRFLSGITSAALLRVIELHGPTLLIDELDALMAGDKEMAQALRGLINAGFDRAGARLIMNVPMPDGYEPREFSCWAPVALAGIGRLPDTVRDRSIELEMKRKLPSETVRKLRRRDGAELNELARKLVRWTEDNVSALKTAAPTMPDGLNDRAADAWEPLVAVADRAGGSWPGLARAASLGLSGEGLKDDNIDALLLSDIRDVFLAKGGDRITGKELIAALNELEDRPWSEWSRGRPMSQAQMSRRLGEYGIVSGTIKTGFGAETAKGFYFRSFEDAFSRYLSPHTPSPPISDRQSGTAVEEQGETTVFQSGTNHDGAAFKNPKTPAIPGLVPECRPQRGGSTGVDKKKTLPPDTIII